MIQVILLLFYMVSLSEAVFRCMNFYGLETERQGFVCDWTHNPEWYIEKLKTDLSINTIRLPFSYEYVTFSDMTMMDNFIETCRIHGINIILDYHRTWSDHQGPVPNEYITMDDFIGSWIKVLNRYYAYDNLIGVGIFNEIQLENDFNYANSMHELVISSLEKVFPDRFYYFAGCPNWGGNCSEMDLSHMTTWNRTFIEVHKYVFSGNSVSLDWDISIPSRIPADHWFVGEVGWKHGDSVHLEWAERFLSYLKTRNITNVCAWTIAHSGDTEGWWKDDCETFNWAKAALLKTLWFGSFKRLREGAKRLKSSSSSY